MEKQDKILITGASGLIGSALLRLLNTEGYENLLTPTHEELDLTWGRKVVDYFFDNKPDYVFHLAAYVGGIQENNNNPAQFIYFNTLMQCHIIGACKNWKVKKLLFPGSACAYPANAEQPIKEDAFLTGMPEVTNLAYALAKQNGIVMAQSYAKQYGMNVVLPMVANTYGIGDFSTHVIPDLIKRMKESKEKGRTEVNVWGGGAQLREFIYADDVATAFLFLMLNYNSPEIINVGTMEEIAIGELTNMVAKAVSFEGNIIPIVAELTGAQRKCLDSSRIREMGWNPMVSLDEGFRRVAASF